LLRFQRPKSSACGKPIVIADPDFDLEKEGMADKADRVQPGARTLSIGQLPLNIDLQALRFERLPGVRLEGVNIAKLLEVRAWLGAEALEGLLKAIRSPRILHLATHGFFLPNRDGLPCDDQDNLARNMGVQGVPPSATDIENPLLRSGLALAGFNTSRRGGSLPYDAEDGVLTAEDVSGLNLLDTELVVLSACETGLGQVQTGEGVYGLRRAFMLAGTRGLVMSLWKVPDSETRTLMEEFYRRILRTEVSEHPADALRAAQLALKEKHRDPLFWGAFIYEGDPGPDQNHIEPPLPDCLG